MPEDRMEYMEFLTNEYISLSSKIDELSQLIRSCYNNEVNFTIKSPILSMEAQLEVMIHYLEILDARLQEEGVQELDI